MRAVVLGCLLSAAAGARCKPASRDVISARDAAAAVASGGGGPIVATPYGDVLGLDSPVAGVEVFLGIPYAEAPTGEKRFRPAMRVANWSGASRSFSIRPTRRNDRAARWWRR